MRILLVRHGQAVDSRAAGSDADRWLTGHGRRSVLAVGHTLTEMGLACTRIYTSPLVRAVQTAELIATAQPSYEPPVEAHRALASEEGTTAEALALLDGALDDDVIAMVTHVPKVGSVAVHLGQLPQTPAFEPGAVCLIDVAEEHGRAIWMLDPDTLALRRF